MVTIRVRLSEREHEAARTEAARLGISLSALVRRALRTGLPADGTRPWMAYAGFVESGDPDSSRKIDEVLYRRE